jgi:hypothetical protein
MVGRLDSTFVECLSRGHHSGPGSWGQNWKRLREEMWLEPIDKVLWGLIIRMGGIHRVVLKDTKLKTEENQKVRES